jgi:hypothetical protein
MLGFQQMVRGPGDGNQGNCACSRAVKTKWLQAGEPCPILALNLSLWLRKPYANLTSH